MGTWVEIEEAKPRISDQPVTDRIPRECAKAGK